MKWLRLTDGLMSFGVAAFYGVAIFVHILLPSVPITNLLQADQSDIVSGVLKNPKVYPKFCTDIATSTEPFCQCLQTGVGSEAFNKCFDDYRGLPAEQVFYSWVNLNFIMFYIFFVSFIYQFVLRNACDVDLDMKGRDVQSAVTICSMALILAAVLSVFNFEHGIYLFALTKFMPHQLILLLVGILAFYNLFTENLTKEMQSKYKNALFSGLYKASVIPFIGICVASMQSWTTLAMIHFIYNILFCLGLADLTYLMLNVDINNNLDRVVARVRVKQATFLTMISCLVAYSLTTVVYMPVHGDILLVTTATTFLILLWVQHLFLDAAHSMFNSSDYNRIFMISDALLAVVRFLIFGFTVWIVQFKEADTT